MASIGLLHVHPLPANSGNVALEMWLKFHENEARSLPGPSVPAYKTKAPILSSLSFVLHSAIHVDVLGMPESGVPVDPLLPLLHCLFSAIILVTPVPSAFLK